MSGRRRRSLPLMVATALVAVTTLLLSVYFVFEYRSERATRLERLDALGRVQIDEIHEALALPVWNFDRAQIARTIMAMARPQSVYGLRVIASGQTFGTVRDADWKLVHWSGKPLPGGLLTYDTPLLFDGNHIGDARLYVSTRWLEEEMSMVRLRIIGTVLGVDLVLVLSVYLMLALLVLRPIQSIERYAMAMSAGRQPEAPTPAATELANLRESIETMVRQLDTRHVELQEEMARRSESEDRFLSIFEAVNDAIMLRDPRTGAILDANQRSCEMFGYTHEELLALPVGGLSSGEGPFDVEAARHTIAAAGPEAQLFEWHVRDRNGHPFWVEVNMRRADIGGEPRVILVGRDITQRREMEKALRMSERLSAIGGLVAGVAHEVRNPLFGISAALDAFEAEFGATEATAEYMTTLRRDVTRLTRLMNDLLEYGQPNNTRSRHVQSVEPVIAEALRVCMPRAKEREVEILPRVGAPLPLVAIDADRMLQVLKNVVENAVEFSTSGGAVTLDAREERNGTSTVVFSISDRGPGFRNDDLPHVFEPFFTRRRGGSGLGLAIVQKIVTEHGGEVSAENAPAGGAKIEIRLPAAG